MGSGLAREPKTSSEASLVNSLTAEILFRSEQRLWNRGAW